MVGGPGVKSQRGLLLDALAILADLKVDELEPDVQLELVEQLETLETACAAAKARASVAFARARVAEALDRSVGASDAADLDVGVRDAGARIAPAARSLTSELALAHRTSPASMSRRLAHYRTIVRALPRIGAAWSRGSVQTRVALAVGAEAHHLTDEQLATLDKELADSVPQMTPRQASGAVRRYCAGVDEETAIRRLKANERDARVGCRPVAEGLACVSIYAPTVQAVGLYAALCKAGAASRTETESLGMAMSREAFQRVTGYGDASQIPIEIALVMSDTTLVTGHGTPARLTDSDFGVSECWLPAPIARHLATTVPRTSDPHNAPDPGGDADDFSAAGWPDTSGWEAALARQPEDYAPRWLRRLYTDPVTGTLDDVDTTRRRFSAAQRRFITHRDQRCTTPWCDAPIRDIDHAEPHAAGGPTTTTNGNGKCQRCNLVKEHPGWQTRTLPARLGQSHAVQITTPSGRSFHSNAPPVLTKPTLPRRGHVPPSSPSVLRPELDLVRFSHPLELGISIE